MSKRGRTETHEFFCLNCAGMLPIARKVSNQKEPFHRKKMFCPYCKLTINMIECKNDYERAKFFEKFNNGDFQEEALESLGVCNL